jgi:hypothetical protein
MKELAACHKAQTLDRDAWIMIMIIERSAPDRAAVGWLPNRQKKWKRAIFL